MNQIIEHNAHETSDAGIWPIVLAGTGLAAGVAIVGLIIWGIFSYLASRPVATIIPNPMVGENAAPVAPTPRIEEHPYIELNQLRAQEDATLSTYGWVDKKAGTVRIPIARAMELELQRGFPAPKPVATPPNSIPQKAASK
jgi:hypothetical protein